MFASKPRPAIAAFLAAMLLYVVVPLVAGTVFGLAYVALSVGAGPSVLSAEEIERGLVVPWVAELLLGRLGRILVVIVVATSVVSTGSAQLVAISSIVIYDLHQTYFKRFKCQLGASSCQLCGRFRQRYHSKGVSCQCRSVRSCPNCQQDDDRCEDVRRGHRARYTCLVHSRYREYDRSLRRAMNWNVVIATILCIPLAVLLHNTGVPMGWVYSTISVLFTSGIPPLAFVVFWSKLTSAAAVTSVLVGSVSGVSVWLGLASTYPLGIYDFRRNTGAEYPVLFGTLTSMAMSTVVAVLVSTCGSDVHTDEDRREVWERTRDVGTPLAPWTEALAEQLNLANSERIDCRPPLEYVFRVFASSRYLALFGSLFMLVVMDFVWPGAMYALDHISSTAFDNWVIALEALLCVGLLFALVMPLFGEANRLHRMHSNPRRRSALAGNWKPPKPDPFDALIGHAYDGSSTGTFNVRTSQRATPSHSTNGKITPEVSSLRSGVTKAPEGTKLNVKIVSDGSVNPHPEEGGFIPPGTPEVVYERPRKRHDAPSHTGSTSTSPDENRMYIEEEIDATRWMS